MRLLIILTVVITILQAFRTSIYCLRKDVSSIKKIIEIVILILMIILCYFNLIKNIFIPTFYIALILSFYTLVSFVYEKLKGIIASGNPTSSAAFNVSSFAI